MKKTRRAQLRKARITKGHYARIKRYKLKKARKRPSAYDSFAKARARGYTKKTWLRARAIKKGIAKARKAKLIRKPKVIIRNLYLMMFYSTLDKGTPVPFAEIGAVYFSRTPQPEQLMQELKEAVNRLTWVFSSLHMKKNWYAEIEGEEYNKEVDTTEGKGYNEIYRWAKFFKKSGKVYEYGEFDVNKLESKRKKDYWEWSRKKKRKQQKLNTKE